MSKFRELFESTLIEFGLLEDTAADSLESLAKRKLKEKYGKNIIIKNETSGPGKNLGEHNSRYFDLVALSDEPDLGLKGMPTYLRYRFSDHPKPEKTKKDEERKPVDIFVPHIYFLKKYHKPYKIDNGIPFYHIKKTDNFKNAYMIQMLAETDKLLPIKHDELKNKLKIIKDNKDKILAEIAEHNPASRDSEELKLYYEILYNDSDNEWFKNWFNSIGKEPAQNKADIFKQAAADIDNKEKRPTLTLGTFKANER